jgi:protein-S-isoprenylcysteine O-methyltransferase Ste14
VLPSQPPDVAPTPGAAGGLGSQLQRWGFTAAGWRDNRHGEWWLAAQLLLIGALLLPAWPAPAALGLSWPLPLRLLGGTLVPLALVGATRSLLRLGPSLTPLPEPIAGAALVTDGPYARCRHPLYRQVLVGALGMTLLLGSTLHLALLLALAAVLGGKARREERSLLQLHPAYAAYRAATPAILPHWPWLDWR